MTLQRMQQLIGAKVQVTVPVEAICPTCERPNGHEMEQIIATISGWQFGGLRSPPGLYAEVAYGDFDTALVPVAELVIVPDATAGAAGEEPQT